MNKSKNTHFTQKMTKIRLLILYLYLNARRINIFQFKLNRFNPKLT